MLALTWPVILANLTIPLVGSVDTAVMGQLPDPAYIGAVAVGATIFSALYWLFGFLRMGTTGLAAQALGALDAKELSAVAQRALGLALMIGAAVLLLQWPLQQLALTLMHSSEQVHGLAHSYFRIRIWGAPAALIYLSILGMLFGLQRMQDTLILGLVLNVTNASLDVLFVIGFHWGVEGVAVGTVISEWFAVAVGLTLLRRALGEHGVSLGWHAHAWHSTFMRPLLASSGNLIVRSFFVQAPFFAYTAVGARLGDLTLAANAVLMQFFFVLIYTMDAFAHTAETLAGQAYGAHNSQRFTLVVRYTTIWAALLAALGAVIFSLAHEPLIALFTESAAVRAEASTYAIWLVMAPLASVWAFQLDGIFIGTTQTATMRNAMALAFIVFVVVLWLSLDKIGNHGLWLAMLAFMLCRAVLLGRHYPRLLATIQGRSLSQR